MAPLGLAGHGRPVPSPEGLRRLSTGFQSGDPGSFDQLSRNLALRRTRRQALGRASRGGVLTAAGAAVGLGQLGTSSQGTTTCTFDVTATVAIGPNQDASFGGTLDMDTCECVTDGDTGGGGGGQTQEPVISGNVTCAPFPGATATSILCQQDVCVCQYRCCDVCTNSDPSAFFGAACSDDPASLCQDVGCLTQ